MQKTIAFLAILCTFQLAQAQRPGAPRLDPVPANVLGAVDPIAGYNKTAIQYKSGQYYVIGNHRVIGSPFLLGRVYKESTLQLKDGRSIVGVELLYDTYNQVLQFVNGKDTMELVDPVKEFSIMYPVENGKEATVKTNFINADQFGKGKIKGYFQELTDGKKAALLKLYSNRISDIPYNSIASEYMMFEQFVEYYVYTTDKKLHKLKLNYPDVVKALDKDKRIEEYLSTNQPNLAEEAQIIKLIDFYNAML
jgi:hypothetical protein